MYHKHILSTFINLILLLIILQQRSSATPLPAHSINQPALIGAPTGFSNYVDSPLDKINAPNNAALLDVKSTIAQVQNILQSDPTLPRLTRGEIEDLFEEVTKEEYEKSLKAGDLTRAKHMRALMLVLPYNTNNTSENELQELYNRPPVTKVISTEPKEIKKQKHQKIVVPSGRIELANVGKQNPTTYKPTFRLRPLKTVPDPTTYRPPSSVFTSTTTKTTIPSAIIVSTETPTIFVTPRPFSTKTNSSKFSSHYNAEQSNFEALPFKPIPTQKSKQLDPELEDILESLGFSLQSQSRKRFKLDDPPPQPPSEELSKRMLSSTIKQNYSPEPYAFLPSAPTLSAKDFTKSFMVSNSPRDFGAFKPIPDTKSAKIQPDLEDYLKKFGLFPPFENRTRKAMSPSTIISDRIDENVDDVIMIAPEPAETPPEPTIVDADQEDHKKLEELLRTLRELQKLNGSLSIDVLSKLDPRHFNLSESLLSHQGPNPIYETEIDLTKNEIKRQTESPEPIKYNLDLANLDELSKDTTTATSISLIENSANADATAEDKSEIVDGVMIVTPEPSATRLPSTSAITSTTTTEESPPNNLEELGESFAGGLGNADDAEPLPPPRRNGFYFLKDWNSFLEVGEDPDKIVVRFDPKAGDPSRFIPVNVP